MKTPIAWYRPPSEDAPDGEAVYGPRDPNMPGMDEGWLPAYSTESWGVKTVEIDGIKHDHHPAFAFRECEDSHAGEPVPQTISGVPPELFAQQIAAAMRYADAPLTHDQFVTLVLYLKARAS